MLAQVKQVYGEIFPHDVRLFLTSWIEENFKIKQLEPQNQSAVAKQLVNQIDVTMNNIPDEPDKLIIKHRLHGVSRELKQLYSGNLPGLYLRLWDCLEEERRILHQYTTCAVSQEQEQELSNGQKIQQELVKLNQMAEETNLKLSKLKKETQNVNSNNHDLLVYRSSVMAQDSPSHGTRTRRTKLAHDQLEDKVRRKEEELREFAIHIRRDIEGTVSKIENVQKAGLSRELSDWSREQQLAGNGHQMTRSLETLQEICSGLAAVIWKTRNNLKTLEDDHNSITSSPPAKRSKGSSTTSTLSSKITALLVDLVRETFIIEEQPPQVMQKNKKFSAKVRLLVGKEVIHMALPCVTVCMVSESEVRGLLNTRKKIEDYSSDNILNGRGKMEWDRGTKQVSLCFQNLQLKSLTRKKGGESVMEEKSCLLFSTKVEVDNNKVHVWRMSLPVVSVTHGCQDYRALATIIWDNAFAPADRKAFEVPDKVLWPEMAAALNMKWKSETNRGLSEANLDYLACKVMRDENLQRDSSQSLQISWSQFCQDKLPGRNFTFWEWFFRIMKLTSNHLKDPWAKGYIMGFVSKQEVQRMLLDSNLCNGTFILRFSDSETGGVTIAYVREDPQNYNIRTVQNLAPFTNKDLNNRSIANVIIFDLNDFLSYVYQSTTEGGPRHKDVFKDSTCENIIVPSISSGGYVHHQLRTHLDSGANNGNGEFYHGELQSRSCVAVTGFMSPLGVEIHNIEITLTSEEQLQGEWP